jgi:hypothetical protein
MHFIISMSKRVVRRVPSLRRAPASMVMACAGQIASHSLQAMQRSSPFGYRRNASSPRKRGESDPFSNG